MRPVLFGFLIAASVALAPAWAAGGEKEDSQFARQIAMSLRDSGKFQHFSMGVKYSKGTVWLSGRVSNKQQMISALQMVSDMQGVHKVVNSLTVGPAKGQGGPGPRTAQGPQRRSAGMSKNSGVQQAGANMPLGVRRAYAVDDGSVPDGYTPLDEGGDDMSGAGAGAGAGMSRGGNGRPLPSYVPGAGGGPSPAVYDQANVPNYSWPSYAAYPNYAALTYPKQYSATAWPFIGPFYPYPQVPLGWRKVSLEWHDGWWFLDFDDRGCQ